VATANWSDVIQKARNVARDLKSRNKQPVAYGPSGKRVNGWAFHYVKQVTDPSQTNNPNDYDEYVHYTKLVLGSNGKVYVHDEGHYIPRGEARVSFNRIELAHPRYLRYIDDRSNGYDALYRLLIDLSRF